MEVRLRFKYHDEKTTEAVSKAIKPDNLKTPEFMIINTRYDGCEVFWTRRAAELRREELIDRGFSYHDLIIESKEVAAEFPKDLSVSLRKKVF